MPYDVTAEFYDLLQATAFQRTAEILLDRWLGEPRASVLDIGAGTGIATALLAGRCHVTVHAVEPSAGMRSVLLSRLAGHPELLQRVRVHAAPIQSLGLRRAADFALCLNTMGTLAPDERRDALAALGTAMVRGGLLVVQRPPEAPGPVRADLPAWYLGGDTYSGEICCTRTGGAEIEWAFVYRVTRDDVVIREARETFGGYLVTAAGFADELAAAGFTEVGTDEPDIVVARRIG